MLTGIHLGNYGKDLHDGTSLSSLVAELVKIPELLRIRLGSIESVELEELIRIIQNEPKVCRHLHLPIQSGSDSVLKGMNRHYRLAKYKALITELRDKIPGLALTTDLIVGFPGETEENFKETLETLKEIRFSGIHVFPYSQRTGTPAATYPDQVSNEVKKSESIAYRSWKKASRRTTAISSSARSSMSSPKRSRTAGTKVLRMNTSASPSVVKV